MFGYLGGGCRMSWAMIFFWWVATNVSHVSLFLELKLKKEELYGQELKSLTMEPHLLISW